jgi:hypothetical protein
MTVNGRSKTRTNRQLKNLRQCQCDSNCSNEPLPKHPFCQYHTTHGCPIVSPTTGYEPVFDKDEYTLDKGLQHSHNCYAYALGVKDLEKAKKCREQKDCKFPVTGKKAGHPEFSGQLGKMCSDIMARTVADIPDAIHTDFTTKCPAKMSKIAVVTDDKEDLHYYREGADGMWDHKPGAREPTQFDSTGSRIWNPELASRTYEKEHKDDITLDYRNFCGFLCIPRDKPIEIMSGGKKTARRKTRKGRGGKKTMRSRRKS